MPKVLNHLDLDQNELRNSVLERRSSPPTVPAPIAGQQYFDTSLNKVGVFNGSTWDYAGVGGVTAVNTTAPITSTGGSTPTIAINPASGSSAGSMSASDKTKLDGATAINTASAIVQRDSSGNFAAGTITANLTGNASNASNLGSQTPAFYLDRANHTGTQTAASVSDFDTQVRTSRLDQMATPTANVSLGSNRITNLADGTTNTDAASWGQVQALFNGTDNKASVRVATTASLALTSATATTITKTGGLPSSIDGVTLTAGDRILVKDESGAGATGGSANGIYIYAAGNTWTRATDADLNAEVTTGLFTFVEEGTVNGSNGYTLTTPAPITLGTTALTFTQTSGAGQTLAGAGLTKTGNQIDVGAGTGITVNADSIEIDTAVVTRKFAQNIGDGTSTSIPITHNLNTRDVTWNLYRNSGTYDDVVPDCQRTSTNVITLIFATAPTSNQYRIVIQG